MAATLEIENKLYTVAEWLEMEKRSDIRHEYYYGKLIPMPGEAKTANRIAINMAKILDDKLFEKGFNLFDHDVKAEVVSEGIYRYPDLVVAPIVDDEHEYIVKQPVMLVEVASEGSGHRDRVKKRREYFEVPTLWYYLIVAQDEMYAVLHQKGLEGQWITQFFTEPADVIELGRFELKITLSDIYQRIKLPS